MRIALLFGRRTVPFVLVLVCGALAPAPAPAHDEPLEPTFRVLVEDGDLIDERNGDTVDIVASRDVLSLDRDGRAFFNGSAVGASGGAGYFVADETSLRAPFVVGDAAPALGIAAGGATISRIVEAHASPTGSLLAAVELANGQLNGEALLTEFDGVQRVAAARHVGFGGLCGLSDIGNGISTGQFAAHGNALVFHGVLDTGLCGDNLRGVFRVAPSGSAVETLALEEQAVPGAPGELFDLLFFGPSLNADGAYAFSGRYPNPAGPGLVTTLLVAPAPGAASTALVVVARTGTPIPGTTLQSDAVYAWDIAGIPPGGSQPRVGYAMQGSNESSATAGHQFIFDSASGTAPVFGTGTTDGAFSFGPGLDGVNSTLDLAIAKDNVVVVVADTLGPAIPSGGEAVWRLDPSRSPTAKVVLHEGGPVPGEDPRAVGLTIGRLLTVHLNEQGRLAVECELGAVGTQAILMEDSDPAKAGQFHIVVLRRDTLPMRSGTGVATGLLGEIPNFPRLRGPGADGRQSRFNDRGEFVFRARMNPNDDSPDRSVLYTVSTDPAPEICDVKVKQRGGQLFIDGDSSSDGGSCDLTVHSNAGGDFEISPGKDTTVNGERTPLSLTGVTGNITIRMGDGDDVLRLTSDDLSCDESTTFDVIGNLTVSSGEGIDNVQIGNFEVKRGMNVDLGASGVETLRLSDTCVGGSLKVSGKRVVAVADFENCTVEGATKITLPGAPQPDNPPCDFEFTACAFGRVTVRGSAFADQIRFDRCNAAAAVKIDTRQGVLEDVRINDCDFESSVRIDAKKSGQLVARLTELRADNGGVRVDTGRNGCVVQLVQCHIARRLDLRTGGAPDGSGNLNDIDVDNSFIDGALVLKGKGPQDFVVTRGSKVAEGISINSRGGPLDQFVLFDLEIESGHITVRSRAEHSFTRLSHVTLINGDARIRGTKGNDQAFVVNSVVNGTVQVILDKGDDELEVRGSTIGRNLRVFGGKGTDLVNDDVEATNTVDGETVNKDFEGALPTDSN